MRVETIRQIELAFRDAPMMRADAVPEQDEVDVASQALGMKFPDDYQEFLLRYGGGIVGPYPIFGLRPVELMEEHRWSVVGLTEEIRTSGVNIPFQWVVFSEDLAGNPIGFDATGKIWIYDHDFGGIAELANDFESYLQIHCLKQ